MKIPVDIYTDRTIYILKTMTPAQCLLKKPSNKMTAFKNLAPLVMSKKNSLPTIYVITVMTFNYYVHTLSVILLPYINS